VIGTTLGSDKTGFDKTDRDVKQLYHLSNGIFFLFFNAGLPKHISDCRGLYSRADARVAIMVCD
jgi:hypothetical protein